MELENRVDVFVRRYGIIPEGSRIVAACSGGPDSLALVSVLLALREKRRLVLRIAHFEHGIRGEASMADVEFVRAFAESHGVPCDVAHEDIPAYAKRVGLSLETAARERRYAFLEETASGMGEGTLIATGHHAGDQAETVMMHILRGSGADGLAGMRPRKGNRVRPLLFATRQDILRYLEEKELSPRWDETNYQADAARNRMRLEVLPALRRYSPSADETLCRLAEAEAEIADFLRESADSVWNKIVAERDGAFFLQRPEYRNQPAAVRKTILRRLAEEAGLRQSLGFLHYAALDEFCRHSETGKALSLPCNQAAECRYDEVLFRRREDEPAAWDETAVSLSGITRIEGVGLTIYASPWEHGATPQNASVAVIDLDAITLPLTVRRRRDGDSFRLEGGGRKKVKSLLIDKKVPREFRDRAPIFASGEEILWIGGIRRAAFALVTGETKNAVMLRLEWDDSAHTKGENRT
ncbi:MAG: tRNA lysidine(34) synthetase TilS [Schwartzia sp.]|nr:tRNA lysidine(34) synthetase TilS [Schwartzia sp. (in: firmicutes)]